MASPLIKIPLRKLSRGINWVDQHRIIVYRSKKGHYRACRNVCRHMYGLFSEQGGNELICIRHGWILDPETMTYTSPRGDIPQEELIIEKTKTHLLLFDPPSTEN